MVHFGKFVTNVGVRWSMSIQFLVKEKEHLYINVQTLNVGMLLVIHSQSHRKVTDFSVTFLFDKKWVGGNVGVNKSLIIIINGKNRKSN